MPAEAGSSKTPLKGGGTIFSSIDLACALLLALSSNCSKSKRANAKAFDGTLSSKLTEPEELPDGAGVEFPLSASPPSCSFSESSPTSSAPAMSPPESSSSPPDHGAQINNPTIRQAATPPMLENKIIFFFLAAAAVAVAAIA